MVNDNYYFSLLDKGHALVAPFPIMKAWDTHFLVRHLVEDDPAQLNIVRHELDLAARRGALFWIPDVTLVGTLLGPEVRL